MQTSTLPNGIIKDVNSRVCPSRKGDMVKESNCTCKVVSKTIDQRQKKKNHKSPRLTKETNAKEREEVQRDEGVDMETQEIGQAPS